MSGLGSEWRPQSYELSQLIGADRSRLCLFAAATSVSIVGVSGEAIYETERSLRSYLLLPRPGDLVKAGIFPCAFLLGVLSEGGTGGREVLRAA
jgi:hypothetical protein